MILLLHDLRPVVAARCLGDRVASFCFVCEIVDSYRAPTIRQVATVRDERRLWVPDKVVVDVVFLENLVEVRHTGDNAD